MIQRLIESFFNWIIDLSFIEENFEVSNRNLTRLMWQRYRIVLLFLIIFALLFTWYIIAIQNGDVQFQTEAQKLRHFSLSIMAIFISIGSATYFIWEWIRLFRNRRILFQTYLELDNELANLAEADYIDERLQIYIYRDFLVSISIGSWLSIIDLNQFQLMEISSKEIGEDARTHYVKVTLDNGKKVKLVMPNCWDIDTVQRLEELQELQEYIDTYY